MKPAVRHSSTSVEVWIELVIGHGHAELKVKRKFWGFWPDESTKRIRAPRSKTNPKNDPNYRSIHGGYLGKIEPRSQTDFAYEYSDRVHAEAPLHGKSIPFHRFRFTTTSSVAEKMTRRLEQLQREGVEYNVRNRGGGFNCVGLTVRTLKEFGLLPRRFSMSRRAPSPTMLKEELHMLAEKRQNVHYDLRVLNPPRFTSARKPRKW